MRMSEQVEMERNFWAHLPGAFAYPFQAGGIYALIAGTIGLSIAFFVIRFIPLPSIIVAAFVKALIAVAIGGYLSAYAMKILSDSASGKKTPTSLGEIEIRDFWEDIANPFGLMLGTFAFCFAPAIVAYLLLQYRDMGNMTIVMLLAALGALYFPMGLALVSLAGTLAALNPLSVIRAITRMPAQYTAAAALFFFVAGLRWLTGSFPIFQIPIIGGLLNWFAFFYLLLVAMHILGLLAYCNSDRLWPK
jgi:hypothetical protein